MEIMEVIRLSGGSKWREEMTTISISKNLRDMIQLLGTMGDSYDDVVGRMYNYYVINELNGGNGRVVKSQVVLKELG